MPLMHLIHPKLGGYGHFSSGIVIDYKGNLKISIRSNKIIGNVLKDNLEQLYFQNPIMENLRNKKIAGCQGCPHINNCGGDRNIAYATYGDFLASDPGCWFYDKLNKTSQFSSIINYFRLKPVV